MTKLLGQKLLEVKSNKYYHSKASRRYIKIHGPRLLDPDAIAFYIQ